MKMVAASKLRRAQQAIAGARSFSAKLNEISEPLIRQILSEQISALSQGEAAAAKVMDNLHPLLSSKRVSEELENTKKATGLVVVTADRGLCGAYNTNAVRMAWRRYNELLAKGDDVVLYFVGKKGVEFFKKKGLSGHSFPDFWSGKFDLKKADSVAKFFEQRFLAGNFDSLEVSYTEFRSAISQTPKVKKMLPMSLDVEQILAETPVNGKLPTKAYYEPSPKELVAKIMPEQLRMSFYAALADSLASELGSKMSSMDNATRNAGEMISGLTLQANRVRQASITTELMEIIGGAEALKG
jgi:F-type H+-transporting ATPase subunit gamma